MLPTPRVSSRPVADLRNDILYWDVERFAKRPGGFIWKCRLYVHLLGKGVIVRYDAIGVMGSIPISCLESPGSEFRAYLRLDELDRLHPPILIPFRVYG